jgi:hypothetical protein
MLKAMNLVTKRDAGDEALGGRSSSGRHLFLVPWRDRALFGTWESDRECDPGDTAVAERDVAQFIAELNQAFPALDLSMADVTLVHRGVVPAVVHGDRVALEGRDRIRVAQRGHRESERGRHEIHDGSTVAERITDTLLQAAARARRLPDGVTTLPGGSVRDVGLAIAGDAEATQAHRHDSASVAAAAPLSRRDGARRSAGAADPPRARLAGHRPELITRCGRNGDDARRCGDPANAARRSAIRCTSQSRAAVSSARNWAGRKASGWMDRRGQSFYANPT